MNTKTILIFSVLLTLLVSGLNAGEDISLSASLDKTEIPFEGNANLTLQVKWQGDITRYAFEVIPLPELENLKVLGTSSSISSGTEDGQEVTTRIFKFALRPTGSGVGTINPIVLKCIAMPDSIPGELSTQTLNIAIGKPLPPPEKSNNGKYLIALVVLIVIVAVILAIVKSRRKPLSVPVRTPEEVFSDELAIIKKESQADRKIFFTRLHSALVGYLKNKHNILSSGRTAKAIAEDIDQLEISSEEKERLVGWLTQAEKEKYAPFGGEPGDLLRLTTELEKFFAGIK